MIIAGYMGAVSVVTTVKWFWFLFGMAMFLPVVYSLARTFRETVITRKVALPSRAGGDAAPHALSFRLESMSLRIICFQI